MSSAFASGKYVYQSCQRCGLPFKYNDLGMDGDVQGLIVCRDCNDPPHPQDFGPRNIIDPIALRYPSPLPFRADAITTLPYYDAGTGTTFGPNWLRIQTSTPSTRFTA